MIYLSQTSNFLPEAVQRPISTLLLVTVGFFCAKILSAIVSNIIPQQKTDVGDEFPSLRIRVSRACFWCVWLAFGIIGLKQLPFLFPAIEKIATNRTDAPTQIVMGLGAVLILCLEPRITQFIAKQRGKIPKRLKIKTNSTFTKLIPYFCLILFIVACGISLDAPNTYRFKIVETVLVIFTGVFLMGMFKKVAASLLDMFKIRSEFLLRFISYFVFMAFIVTSFEIWI